MAAGVSGDGTALLSSLSRVTGPADRRSRRPPAPARRRRITSRLQDHSIGLGFGHGSRKGLRPKLGYPLRSGGRPRRCTAPRGARWPECRSRIEAEGSGRRPARRWPGPAACSAARCTTARPPDSGGTHALFSHHQRPRRARLAVVARLCDLRLLAAVQQAALPRLPVGAL